MTIKLYENIKPVVNSPYWLNVKKLLEELVEQKRDSLERVKSFDEVQRARGYIEAMREVIALENTVKELDTIKED